MAGSVSSDAVFRKEMFGLGIVTDNSGRDFFALSGIAYDIVFRHRFLNPQDCVKTKK